MSAAASHCRPVKGFAEALHPGDFYFTAADPTHYGPDVRLLHIRLPDGVINHLPVKQGPPTDRTWGWDGNEERPTIATPIRSVGGWRGHLQAGEFKSV